MKKSKLKIVSHALISASLRGFAAFAIFGMALYAYAITYPVNQPNPVSGVVGLYVGKTAVFNGSQSGYANANSKCSTAHPDSHICPSMEIINSYNHNSSGPIASATGSLWVNNGPPGYMLNVANDCNGWKSNGTAIFGSVWNTSKDASFITPCNLTRSFACCK